MSHSPFSIVVHLGLAEHLFPSQQPGDIPFCKGYIAGDRFYSQLESEAVDN